MMEVSIVKMHQVHKLLTITPLPVRVLQLQVIEATQLIIVPTMLIRR